MGPSVGSATNPWLFTIDPIVSVRVICQSATLALMKYQHAMPRTFLLLQVRNLTKCHCYMDAMRFHHSVLKCKHFVFHVKLVFWKKNAATDVQNDATYAMRMFNILVLLKCNCNSTLIVFFCLISSFRCNVHLSFTCTNLNLRFMSRRIQYSSRSIESFGPIGFIGHSSLLVIISCHRLFVDRSTLWPLPTLNPRVFQ